jgi:hypothetical protein
MDFNECPINKSNASPGIIKAMSPKLVIAQ